ncbi:protein-glutamine gamma-glutamyltransferase [Paenibacillus harenae]|uniref:protein-glutamine gamma-glutamyltransferase n=1 Tax=Paenibacillus harenae TaxID=306543 RepID=UPI0027906A71|nr:protein-glutamine gamma-glutamyltransferase [Paenibacillus harenae]MDQ0062235.1 protein-glutamine gamma-glutamyltransferase [Paenibacillus harenae]
MINITGSNAQQISQLPLTELQRSIVRQKERSPEMYRYPSLQALQFELVLRSNIVQAAKDLNDSGASFAVFKKSRCNERLWSRTEAGGFKLRPGVLPSDGIRDIYANGELYAFECATAIVILLYKAMLETLGESNFNRHFRDLLLYDWTYDNDLRLITLYSYVEAYPGDILYFENPDHDDDRPEWQGENVIKLANDLYYGHGVGIKSAAGMIEALNRTRNPGSTKSAFLSDLVNHPDFGYLMTLPSRSRESVLAERAEPPVVARIGTAVYVYRNHKMRKQDRMLL